VGERAENKSYELLEEGGKQEAATTSQGSLKPEGRRFGGGETRTGIRSKNEMGTSEVDRAKATSGKEQGMTWSPREKSFRKVLIKYYLPQSIRVLLHVC
jgi:hypothetical protein